MESFDVELENARKSKAEQKRQEPAADRPRGLNWASALGNAAVQRLLRSVGVHRSGGDGPLDDSVGKAIQAKRGTGQSLDSATQRGMEDTMGEDFSDVRVHTDSEADGLNRAVQAEAFTTGRDVFFREGKYNPGSPEGRKLLSHELTHVVQQRSAPPAQDLTVSSPDDASEQQASHVAEQVSGSPAGAPLARQPVEEEEEQLQASRLERQPVEEEEEQLQASRLERQPVEEEEEGLQASPATEPSAMAPDEGEN